jgi:hypothetical protein
MLRGTEEEGITARTRSLLPPLAVLATALQGACHGAPAPPAISPTASAREAVLLRLQRHPGEARHFQRVMDNYVHLGPGDPPSGDSARPTMHLIQFVTESVTAVSGDTFTIAFISDSNRVAMPGYNLAGAALDTLVPHGLTMTMRMDSRGRVISVQLERAVLAEGRMATLRMLLPGADSSGASNSGTMVHFPDLPARVGEAWGDTAACPRALRGCEGGLVRTYRLERVEESGGRRIAVISWETDMPPTTVEGPLEVSSGPMHFVGEERLDLGAGWFVERSMTMTGTAHSQMGDMSMRMQTRETPVPSTAGSGAGAPPAAPPMRPRILMRRAAIPTPTTLDSLMALFRRFEPTLEFPECRLPDVAPAADWVDLAGPDEMLRIRLPPGWRAGPPDSTFFGEPETVLEDSTSSRIRISRVISVGGRHSLNRGQVYGRPTELPHTEPCRVGAGADGSIWTLYAPDSGVTSGPLARYNALGDLLAASGRRYSVTVGARTAEARDRAVRIVADAASTSH